MRKLYVICTTILTVILTSCGGNATDENNLRGYDQIVLKTWSEKMAIPAFTNYNEKVIKMHQSAQEFYNTTTEASLQTLKTNWVEAYKAFQKTMIFNLAPSIGVYYLEMSNTYPTVVTPQGLSDFSIERNIQYIVDGQEDMVKLSPSRVENRHSYQGFPALDYLLYSSDKNVDFYQNNPAAKKYVLMLTEALKSNAATVLKSWNDMKESYIADTDTSVEGYYISTINSFLKVYEKQIRAYKVGYASGLIKAQNGVAQPEIIEAYYNEEISSELLKIAVKSSQDFFNGTHFDGSGESKSLRQILVDLEENQLIDEIDRQYAAIYSEIDGLSDTLKSLALNESPEMKKLYDLLQKNVGSYKTKMIVKLNAVINYLDTDGD